MSRDGPIASLTSRLARWNIASVARRRVTAKGTPMASPPSSLHAARKDFVLLLAVFRLSTSKVQEVPSA